MEKGKKNLRPGVLLIAAFLVLTWLIMNVDVKPLGVNGTDIGFSTINCWFHDVTGVNMTMYVITDWMGLVPIMVCILFGFVGLIQWIKRKKLLKVDTDILSLGIYYVLVIIGYAVFEMVPINYRPILIDGYMEASYPSSTTLLVLSVMPTLIFQSDRRLKSKTAKKVIRILTASFMAFMVIGRLTCGVHWLTDIAGGVLLSLGLFFIYKAAVLISCTE